MSLRFHIEPEAAVELDEAANWYEEKRLDLGRDFLEAVDEALAFIASWPRSGNPFQTFRSVWPPVELLCGGSRTMLSISKLRARFVFSRLHMIVDDRRTGTRGSLRRSSDHCACNFMHVRALSVSTTLAWPETVTNSTSEPTAPYISTIAP